MPTSTSSKPNRDTVPPGLLMAADLIARIPERKQDMIAYEIKHRERQHSMMRDTRNRMSWHPVQTVKSLVLYGLNGFALAWATGALASLGQTYEAVKTGKVAVPLPLLNDLSFGLGSIVPTSTILAVAAKLPQVSLRDAVIVGGAIALLVIIERLIITIIHWKHSRALGEAEKELEEEIEILRTWGSAG